MLKQTYFFAARGVGSWAAIALIGATLAPATASAYIGPGAGLTAIGSLVAIAIAVLIALVGLVWFPLRLLLKNLRGKQSITTVEFDSPPGQEAPAASKTDAN